MEIVEKIRDKKGGYRVLFFPLPECLPEDAYIVTGIWPLILMMSDVKADSLVDNGPTLFLTQWIVTVHMETKRTVVISWNQRFYGIGGHQ